MNPLHGLIGLVYQFINAGWCVHQAKTNQERLCAMEAWRAVTGPFWARHRIPTEALRGLADPVLAWLHHQHANRPENVEAVEVAAAFAVQMAMSIPTAQPSVYSNKAEARPHWEKFGEALLDGQPVLDGLRRLAALTGTPWQWDRRLPWEPEPPTPEPDQAAVLTASEQVATLPSSPVPPAALIEAAMRDVPGVLADVGYTQEQYGDALAPGERILPHHRIVRELGDQHRHCRAAAEWAIHRLAEQGLLRARHGRGHSPSWQNRDGSWSGGESYEVRDLAHALLETTPRLWEWWRGGTTQAETATRGQPERIASGSCEPPGERVIRLHGLAVACANAVLGLGTLRFFVDGRDRARAFLLDLRRCVEALPDLPLRGDPFSGSAVFDLAGVKGTSAHTAVFALARRVWQAVQVTSLTNTTTSECQGERGESYTRATSEVVQCDPTTIEWTAAVWGAICEQLAGCPTPDPAEIESALALELDRARLRAEERGADILPGTRASEAQHRDSVQPSAGQLGKNPGTTDRVVQEVADLPLTEPPADPVPKIDKEALAIALLFKHKDWSLVQIAEHLEVDRKTLYKWKQFRAAAELAGKMKPREGRKQTPRRGFKTADGQIEAYQNEDEDE